MRRGKEGARDAQAPQPKGLLGFVVLGTRVRFGSVLARLRGFNEIKASVTKGRCILRTLVREQGVP